MKTELLYGKKSLELNIPDFIETTVINSRFIPGIHNPAQATIKALENPIGFSRPLSNYVKPQDTVAVVVSDITRATPYGLILPVLLSELQKCVSMSQILFFVATGTHRKNTREELIEILGDSIVSSFRIIQNDALDDASHECFCTTKNGNKVFLNRRFLSCNWKILTGFIEPHFFAGFSGGGKAIMPGLASLSTIMSNHSVTNIDNPNAAWGKTTGNPIYEEIMEIAGAVPGTFLINVNMNRNKEITGIFAGDLFKAHGAGCAFVKENAMAAVNYEFDIVITGNSGYPLDQNLYQSVKGMSAASLITKEQGTIIMAAECSDGIPDCGEYGTLLKNSESPDSLLKSLRTPGYQKQDMWQAQIHARICMKTRVYFFSSHLNDKQITDSFLIPCRNIETTLLELIKKNISQPKICVIPEGPLTIPYLNYKQ